MRKIVVASNNEGKIREIKRIFEDYEILTLKEIEEKIGQKIEVIENEDTFKGNAISKVKSVAKVIPENYYIIADDSGIELDALDGFPGVYTHRWLDGTDEDRNLGLIEKLKGKDNRTCRFKVAIACYHNSNVVTAEEELVGKVPESPRGENGFGFDPIFELDTGKTLAEITMEEKNKIGCRKKALMKIHFAIENGEI